MLGTQKAPINWSHAKARAVDFKPVMDLEDLYCGPRSTRGPCRTAYGIRKKLKKGINWFDWEGNVTCFSIPCGRRSPVLDIAVALNYLSF